MARLPCCERVQGAAADNGSEAGTRTAVWAAFWSYCGLGGIPNFELLIFGLIEMLNFEVSSDLEFLRRALIAPDAATAGGSSPRLCVDRACPRLMLQFYRGGYCA